MKKNSPPLLLLLAISVSAVFLMAYATSQTQAQTTDKLKARSAKSLPAEQKIYRKGPRAWALACSAILTELNKGLYDQLPVHAVSPMRRKQARKLINDSWGIKCYKDWLNACKWLDRGGHRALFNMYSKLLNIQNEQVRNRFLKVLTKRGYDIDYDISIVKKYRGRVGSKGIIGWDFSRYIYASYMRIPDRAEWKVLIDKVLYTGETGIFNWDGYIYHAAKLSVWLCQ